MTLDWPAVNAVLGEVFGPALARLFERLLSQAAEHLPRPDPDAEHAAQLALLFDAAISLAPLRQKVALRILRRHATHRAGAIFAVASDPRATSPEPLSSAERAEVAGVAG